MIIEPVPERPVFKPEQENGRGWLRELIYGAERACVVRASAAAEDDEALTKSLAQLEKAKEFLNTHLLGVVVTAIPINKELPRPSIKGHLGDFDLEQATISLQGWGRTVTTQYCHIEYATSQRGATVLYTTPLIELQTDKPYNIG